MKVINAGVCASCLTGMTVVMSGTARALDNTQSNGFWDTTAYVNATPVCQRTVDSTVAFGFWNPTIWASSPYADFCSSFGLLLLFK